MILSAADARLRQWAGSSGMQLIESGPTLTVRADQFECHIERVVLNLATELDCVMLPVPKEGLISAFGNCSISSRNVGSRT